MAYLGKKKQQQNQTKKRMLSQRSTIYNMKREECLKKKKVIHMSHRLLSLRDGLYDHRTRGEPGYCVGVQNSNVVFFFVLSGSVLQILPTRVRRRQKMSDNVQTI